MTAGDIEQRIDTLDDEVRIASESGLFTEQHARVIQILDKIQSARDNFSSNNLNAAMREIGEGEALFDQTIQTRGWWWRFRFLYNFPLLLYYIGVLFLLFIVWYNNCHSCQDQILFYVPMWSIVLGALGAVLRGLWFLYFHVSRKQFRSHWAIAHLLAPPVGGILGLLAYLLLHAGFVSISGTAVSGSETKFTDTRLPMAVAFLAGYSWEWILGLVGRVTGRTA